MKQPIILRVFKQQQLVEVKQFDVDQVIFGNEGDVQIKLQDPAVSSIHCLIELRDSGYYLCDLGSASGTSKNGKPVLDEPISSGDYIEIGPFRVQFFVGVPKPKAPPQVVVEPPKPVAPPVSIPTEVKQEAVVPPPQEIPAAPPVVPVAPIAPVAPVSETPAPPKLPETARIVAKSPEKTFPYSKKKKGQKTFAPPSSVGDLRKHLKPSKGPVVEVIVAWKERVLESYHFNKKQVITVGSDEAATIQVPSIYLRGKVPFIEMKSDVRVSASADMEVEAVNSAGELISQDDLLKQGKATRSTVGVSMRLDQGEMIICKIGGGDLLLILRFVPATPIPLLATPLDLSAGELTGIVVSVMIALLMALYFSVYQPSEQMAQEEDEQLRVAQFIYTPPTTLKKPEPPPPTQPPNLQATNPPMTTTTQAPRVVRVDMSKEQQKKGNPKSAATATQQAANRASEVKPIPNSQNRRKTFTSTKQGGATKVGETEGSNAPTVDPNTVGLAGAFGGGGLRQRLDQAYSGAGDIMGMADRATGAAGQNTDRAGDDIGSRFKDTGAGGKGTATQGISSIGTKGRGGGMSTYGDGVGLGERGAVSIEAGGFEEGWEGSIDREAVRRVIRGILNQIRSCYVRSLRTNEEMQGRVVIEFEIVEQGMVRRASTKSSSLRDNNRVGDCISTLIRAQKFPEPPVGQIAVVSFPFEFRKQQ